jgi:hypothetical protein
MHEAFSLSCRLVPSRISAALAGFVAALAGFVAALAGFVAALAGFVAALAGRSSVTLNFFVDLNEI